MNMTDEFELDQLTNIETRNRERLATWFDAIGREPVYPATSDTVVRLLRVAQYATSNDILLQAVNEMWIPPVAREAGRLAWSATDIVALSCALEARRMWQPCSPLHSHKLTMAEKLRELSENGEAINDLHKFDFDALLAILIQVSGDSSAVICMAEALRQKLKSEGVL
jgi:hypothetical protein